MQSPVVLRSENADSGAVEDVWLRATYADSVLREHLLGWYERSGDTVRSFFPGWSIVPERGDSGLGATHISCLFFFR